VIDYCYEVTNKGNLTDTQMQNLHLEHPEDTVLSGDLKALDCLLHEGHLSVKLDGAPAIVWGINPANGLRFVGTKAVFNKVKIRIAHSHEEIDQFYSGEVAVILHCCFDCLPHTDSIIQGDFIGFGDSDEFTPNTITYKFGEVIDQQIIIAPHTEYFAENDLRDAVCYPLVDNLSSTETCYFLKPECYVQHSDSNQFHDLKEVIGFAKQMAQLVNFATPKEAIKITRQLNKCIREGQEIDAKDFDCDHLLIEFWKLVKSIKEDALFLCRNLGPAAYIGYDRIDAEGYVFSNALGSIKLVNREVFSMANFNNSKFSVSS
jgi:hypothetical protein